MMSSEQALLAQNYLQQKEDLLNQCLKLTDDLLGTIGDIPQAHAVLIQRKQLLATLAQLDQDNLPQLSAYAFDEIALNKVNNLSAEVWRHDAQITDAMQNFKTEMIAHHHAK